MPTDVPRIRVLSFIDYYLPGYRAGGSVTSLSALVHALATEVEFHIVTRNRDAGSNDAYRNTGAGQWLQIGYASVAHFRPGPFWPWTLWRVLSQVRPDVVYLNSFFSPWFSFVPLLTVLAYRGSRDGGLPRVLIAPRGEFSSGALRIRSRRKNLYVRMFRWFGLQRRVCWHASTGIEAEEIRGRMGDNITVREALDPWLVDNVEYKTSTSARRTKVPGSLDAIFISRISPKKNLHLVCHALGAVIGEVQLRIFGPIEDEAYWQRCQTTIATLPSNVSVSYCGELQSNEVVPMFASAQVFLFPTAGENFGHVIREALESGCVPIISDQTPWNDLESFGAGWVCKLTEPDMLASAIQEAIDLEGETWKIMSDRGRQYVAERCQLDAVANQNVMLFRNIAGMTSVETQ